MIIQDKEKIDSILKSHDAIKNIEWGNKSEAFSISDIVTFTVHGVKYLINWSLAGSELYCGEMKACSFDYLAITDTYPNTYRVNLVFCVSKACYGSKKEKAISVIPLEKDNGKDYNLVQWIDENVADAD